MVASRQAKAYRTLLGQKFADYFAFVLVLDASKEFCAEGLDRFRAIKWQLVINFSATEVTRLTFRFQDGFDVSDKVDFVVAGGSGRRFLRLDRRSQ